MYILSTVYNSNGIVKYENDISYDYKYFLLGERIYDDVELYFKLKSKKDIMKIKKMPLIITGGPVLVRADLKIVLEKIISSEYIQFFNIRFIRDDSFDNDFYAMNIIGKYSVVDMNVSEFKQLNFDYNNPEYVFYYLKLMDENSSSFDIGLCKEYQRYIVISNGLKNKLMDSHIKGLKFCKAIDLTPLNRTLCEIIV